jgi:hypothetical protein
MLPVTQEVASSSLVGPANLFDPSWRLLFKELGGCPQCSDSLLAEARERRSYRGARNSSTSANFAESEENLRASPGTLLSWTRRLDLLPGFHGEQKKVAQLVPLLVMVAVAVESLHRPCVNRIWPAIVSGIMSGFYLPCGAASAGSSVYAPLGTSRARTMNRLGAAPT